MKYTSSDYAEALYEAVIEAPEKRTATIKRFLERLKRDRATSLLPIILDKLDQVEAIANNQPIITVVSAKALTAKQRNNITQALDSHWPKSDGIRLIERVEPSVLGGLRIEYNDQVVDNTVVSKLNLLAARL